MNVIELALKVYTWDNFEYVNEEVRKQYLHENSICCSCKTASRSLCGRADRSLELITLTGWLPCCYRSTILSQKNTDGINWYTPKALNVCLKDHIRALFSLAQWSTLCTLYLRLCIFVLWLWRFRHKQFPSAATANKCQLCTAQHVMFFFLSSFGLECTKEMFS